MLLCLNHVAEYKIKLQSEILIIVFMLVYEFNFTERLYGFEVLSSLLSVQLGGAF